MFEGAARLVLIQADQVPSGALMREVVIDETRRSFTFKLDGISVPQSQLLDGANFAALEQAAMLMLVAEMSGGLAGVLHVIMTISQRVNNLITTLAVTNRSSTQPCKYCCPWKPAGRIFTTRQR